MPSNAPWPACRATERTRRERARGTAPCADPGTHGATDRIAGATHEAAGTRMPSRHAAARPCHHPAIGGPR
jgi:hypothetical protein